MRRSLFAAVLALVVLAWPVEAQVSNGHVLVDMTVMVSPGFTAGHCVLLDTGGTMEVSLSRADTHDDGALGPPTFSLGPYRTSPAGTGAPPEIQGQPVGMAKATVTLPVVSGLYCYNLYLPSTPAIDVLPSRERTAEFRFVTLRMTLGPAA